MSLLLDSLAEAGLKDTPVDLVVVDTEESAKAREFSGSPSFCVNDIDLFPARGTGLACRLYHSHGDRWRGLPDRGLLVDRLRHAMQGA